MTHYGRVI